MVDAPLLSIDEIRAACTAQLAAFRHFHPDGVVVTRLREAVSGWPALALLVEVEIRWPSGRPPTIVRMLVPECLRRDRVSLETYARSGLFFEVNRQLAGGQVSTNCSDADLQRANGFMLCDPGPRCRHGGGHDGRKILARPQVRGEAVPSKDDLAGPPS